MKLSIITVNLNNRDGLQRTIDSVVGQTFRDFEWIVIDGGSTDGSRELIEQHAGHFAYWVSEPDKGIFNAMNKGIKVAKGDYLQFLNSGDSLFSHDILEKAFSSDHTEDILFGTCLVHDPYRGDYVHGPTSSEVSAFQLLSKSIPHQSSFFHRPLFDKYGLYDESYRICADMKFYFNTIVNHNVSLRYLGLTISHFDGSGVSNQHPEIVREETYRVAHLYLPPRSIADFDIYNEVLQNYDIVKTCEKQVEDNRTAIRFYNTMMRYPFSKALTSFILKVLDRHKKNQRP